MSDDLDLPPLDVDAAAADRIGRGAKRELARVVEAEQTAFGRIGRVWDDRVEPVLVGCVAVVYLVWAFAVAL